MAWFKVDDGFYSHPKVLAIPRQDRAEAIGTWNLCGTWSADKLKDGYVPAFMIEELGGTQSGASSLVKVKLWRVKGVGFQFINWEEFQPTRAEIEAKRKAERDRQANYRASHPKNRGRVTHVSQRDISVIQKNTSLPTRPDPTRPKDSSTKSQSPASRGSRVDPNFTITPEMRAWARDNTPLVNVDRKLPEWIDYWTGVAGRNGVKTDWVATWRNGMRKQQEFAERDRGPVKTQPKKVFTAHAD